jgi:hypothetical protein
MADANFEAQRMAELMAQVNEELLRYGQVSRQTQSEVDDAQMKAKYGIQNFTKGTAKGAEAVTALASAAGAAGKAMLEGKKGATAFNESVDSMATAATAAAAALALFVPVLGPLMLAIGAATIGFAKYTKAANDQADKLYKGYQGLAKSGAAASDGMTGLFQNAKKLGLSMNELDSLVSLVGENSRDLAAFGGSVAEGTKRFADMGAAMEPHRQALIKMGMLPEQINEGMAGYLRTQTRLGNAQRLTTDQLAQGAREYLKEQDALTKLTGQARQETEKKREAALMEEQFASKIRQLQLSGQDEAAARLIKLNDMASAVSEEYGRGVRALATGNLVNEDARKLFQSTQGRALGDIQQVAAGTKAPVEGLQSMAKAIGQTNDKMGVQLGVFGAANSFLIGVGEARKIQVAADQNFVKQQAAIEEDNRKREKGGTDAVLDNQAKLIATQIDANKAMEQFINKGIIVAQNNMITLANATKNAANMLNELTPGGKKATASTAENVGEGIGAVGAGVAGGLKGAAMGAALGTAVPIIGNAVGAVVGGLIGSALGVWAGGNVGKKLGEGIGDLAGLPKAAEGGMLKGPTSGYLAMLHGTELVIPEDMLKGSMASMGSGAGSSPEIDKMSTLATEMLKDTEQLVKINDKDLKKQQRYSNTTGRLIDLKMDLMADEIDLLEEQNSMLTEMENMLKKTMGEDQVKETMRAFKMTRMSSMGFGGSSSAGGGAAPAGGSGAAPSVSAPFSAKGGRSGVVSGSGQPVMTGAGVPLTYGEAASKQDLQDLFDFGSASGSKSNFEQLEGGFKNAVIKAAEEYNATTGKKLRVNSAKRDSADQQRLYEAWVARGKTGMPVGRPGMSRHEHGVAVDIQNYGDSQAVAAMNRQGLYQKVPNDPVHFQFAKGGISNGPRSGYLAELHGPEAVVPLPDGKSIPVKMENNTGSGPAMETFKSDLGNMMGQIKDVLYLLTDKMNNPQMVTLMDEMVRAQKNSNDIQNKMLRAQT